ncbi:site-specific integrase [Rhodoferax sp. 4810]|nr:site-specific integrase [Rhodoferax jenense]
MTRNFLTSSRHGTVFYYRRRVPDDLRPIFGKPYLVKTLKTSDRREAIILARAYAGRTDEIFGQVRTMKKNKPGALQADYTIMLELGDLGEPRKLTVQGERHETEAINSAVENMLLNLPNKQTGARRAQSPATAITAATLLDDFFREGIGAERWKNPETARKHDYDPVWRKFSVHVATHGLTLEAAKAYRAEVLAQISAQATKVRDLSHIHAVMSHGVDFHGLDEKILRQLKMPKMGRLKKSATNTSYLPFTCAELTLLFNSNAYLECSFKKPSLFWLPLLGLYTGARLEELAGLHLSAFIVKNGINAILLSDEVTTDGGKNSYALREVPIHKELTRAGLTRYVEQLKAEGHVRLFPEIGEAARDGYGKRASTDFTEYRRSVGVGKEKGERSRLVFHSFRATLAGEFYKHGIDGDLSRRLTGHAAIDVHQGTYLAAASIPMERAALAMDKISFDLVHPPFVDSDLFIRTRRSARQKEMAAERAARRSA